MGNPINILPEPQEPWGWQKPQRIGLAILLALGLVLLLIQWQRWTTRLRPDLEAEHNSLPELEILIDPNTATTASLARIPGVGLKTAEGIVAYRQQHVTVAPPPAFKKLSDLEVVPGIGKKTVELMRPWLKLEESSAIRSDGLQAPRLLDADATPDNSRD